MLGGLLLGVAAVLGAFDSNGDYDDDYDPMDSDMYACTDEWRSLHPYDYNPVTGGWNADEDEANGW